MESNFNSPLSNKSEAELKERIENRQKYMPETVRAAIAELQRRGHLFTDEELKIYNDDMQERLRIAASEKKAGAIFSKEYNYNVVEDSDAPLLYSRRAIYLFTILGTALFGTILLAINSRNLDFTCWRCLYRFTIYPWKIYTLQQFPQFYMGISGWHCH